MFKNLFKEMKDKKEQKILVERRKQIDILNDHNECPVCLSILNKSRTLERDYYEGTYIINQSSCRNGCYTKIDESCHAYYKFNIFNKHFEYYHYYNNRINIQQLKWEIYFVKWSLKF